MEITNKSHLTYCSNIHPGETWKETFDNLKKYTRKVRDHFSTHPFGIGLRLSNIASQELISNKRLTEFKNWLAEENMYVFTLNGFPYGGFHNTEVKENVHTPDWSTADRLTYTKRLFTILSTLLPVGMDGGISSSPLSYRYWFQTNFALEELKEKASLQLIELVIFLAQIKQNTGQYMHLDIEPEPDGVIETSLEFISFFNEYLLKKGVTTIQNEFDCTRSEAEGKIRDHISLCYDVCHFAVGYEDPKSVIDAMRTEGILIGKLQISAAIKASWSNDLVNKESAIKHLNRFDESIYLHQSVLQTKEGKLERFRDLGPGLEAVIEPQYEEIRTHFHVPIFTAEYESLKSTQSDIIQTLDIWKNTPFTKHLEIETYTWDVLPEGLKTDLVHSICRELEWVKTHLED